MISMRTRIAMIWLALAPIWGCGPTSVRQGGFDSDDPASKLDAILRDGENHDPSTVKHLIDQLDSDDPAVRMMAIIALERRVGTRKGYNPYDSVENRRPAIDTWVRTYTNHE